MSKFKEGMIVVVIDENNDARKGTIKRVFEDLGYALVNFEDRFEKVLFKNLGVLEIGAAGEDKESEEPKGEPTEKGNILKDEITITRHEFITVCSKMCAKLHIFKGYVSANVCADFSAELVARLFAESPKKND